MAKQKPLFCQLLNAFLSGEKKAGQEYRDAAQSARDQFQPKWVIEAFERMAQDEQKHYKKLMQMFYKRCS